jgi:GT2 family glycosyltransferase
MKTSTNIAYIILSYNSNPEIIRNNIHLLKEKHVIIVDNTEDPSRKILSLLTSDQLEHVKVLPQSKNSGYAGGMNSGLVAAWKEGCDWAVLLNDDVELSDNGIREFEKNLESKQPGVYGPMTGELEPYRWTTKPSTSFQKEDYVSGSFMVIHKDVDKKLKGFFEDYFMYYEDVDYCIRARQEKFPVQYIEVRDVIHLEGSSIHRGSPQHLYYLARNHLLFVFRQAPTFIKVRELIRLPKTMWEHRHDAGFRGITDVLLCRFGRKEI